MKKRTVLPWISLLLTALLAIGIYAVGSSTGGSDSSSPSTTSSSPNEKTSPKSETPGIIAPKGAECSVYKTYEEKDNCCKTKYVILDAESYYNQTSKGCEVRGFDPTYTKDRTIDCEAQSTLNARIKCRLEQRGIKELNATEESCRVLANPSNCQSLYTKVASCYNLISGQQKDQCFKRIAGFVKAKVRDEASANNKEALRNYLIFLFYDLQEKIEESYESGAITTEQASETISLIVQIKQKILSGQTKSQIKPFMQELKAKVRELNLQ